MALISAAQFRQHYPQLSGSADDTVLDEIIARASALMAEWCNYPAVSGARTLESRSYTLYLGGDRLLVDDPRCLSLPVRPVTALTSVSVDDLWVWDTAEDLTQVELDVDRGELWLRPTATFAWSSGARSNKIVVTAGYATVPDSLEALVAMATRHLWDLRRTQGQASGASGGDSRTYVDAQALLPEAVRQGLTQFTIWDP